jgi:phosphoribosyl 1,2-cyclic phosphodiesterase
VLRFKSLGSGSSGNATLVESSGIVPFRLMIDCGLGIRQLVLRLCEAGLQPEDIDAVFITHEHSDHIGCVRVFCLRYRVPLWMSRGTHAALGCPDFDGLLHWARDGQAIDLGGLSVMPFAVPHDALEPLQVTCTDGSVKLGVVTDLGHANAHVLTHLTGCSGLVLECNHDSSMLSASAYPEFLKRRIGGNLGHLSNSAAASMATAVRHHQLKHFVAAHLSERNNHPELVARLMSKALNRQANDIIVATANSGTPWLEI